MPFLVMGCLSPYTLLRSIVFLPSGGGFEVPFDMPFEVVFDFPSVMPFDVPFDVPFVVPFKVLLDVPFDIPFDVPLPVPFATPSTTPFSIPFAFPSPPLFTSPSSRIRILLLKSGSSVLFKCIGSVLLLPTLPALFALLTPSPSRPNPYPSSPSLDSSLLAHCGVSVPLRLRLSTPAALRPVSRCDPTFAPRDTW